MLQRSSGSVAIDGVVSFEHITTSLDKKCDESRNNKELTDRLKKRIDDQFLLP